MHVQLILIILLFFIIYLPILAQLKQTCAFILFLFTLLNFGRLKNHEVLFCVLTLSPLFIVANCLLLPDIHQFIPNDQFICPQAL